MKPAPTKIPAILRLAVSIALLVAACPAQAQIIVGPTGVTNTFDTLPPASAWSGKSTPGGSSDVNDAGGVDAQAVTNVAATITDELIVAFGNPPPANSSGPVWAAAGFVQTRPAGVRFMLLMARLQNETGLPLSSLEVGYEYTFINHYFTDGSLEQVPGHRVFYSLTGNAFDWQPVPPLSGHTNSGRLSAVLDLGLWPPSAPLFLLWVDDTSATDVDYPLQLDNFTAHPGQLAPIITSPPSSRSIVVGGSVTFQVGASGPGTPSYQWLKDGVAIPGAVGTNFTIASAQLSDVALYSVQVISSYGSVVSESAVLVVSCFGNPAFTVQPQSQFLPAGGTISLSATVSGTPPFSYQWCHDGAPLPGATNATYVKVGATATDAGYYHVAVSACGHTVASVAALVAVGKAPFSLLGLTNQLWRYDQSGTDPGALWREPGYNDSAWPIGRGVLGFDSHPVVAALTNTILARTNSGGSITSHYFRIHFTLTNDPREVLLMASNLVDDGCVVYLNGHEAYRINMPGGPVTATTLAPQSAIEGLFLTASLPSSFLMPGDNVLAAEVHQLNAAHDDVVFGLSLTATFPPPAPLVITDQPANVTLEETRPASFTIGVQGQPAFFQWFRNGVPAPVSMSQPFVIPSVSSNDSGSYRVVVTNAFNSVTSAPFTLTVLRDVRGPVLLEADGGATPTQVLVTFSEAVSIPTATNPANYRITNTLGGILTVASAVLQNGSNVLLTSSSPRLAGLNYLLAVSNVRDASPQSNVIVLNSQRPVRRLASLVNLDSSWRYLDPFPPFDEANLGTAWKEFIYDEGLTYWNDGLGVFWSFTPDTKEAPGPANTYLGETPELISYFRSGFNLAASPGGLRFALTHIIDDGGILYLNGQEMLRVNMPAGPVNYQTPALSAVGTVPRVGPLLFDGALPVRPGSNVIAFELHQVMAVDLSKAFGLELEASVQSYLVGPVVVTGGPEDVTVTEGTPATFSVVQAGGATFGWQQNSNALPGATNGSHVIPSVPLSLNGARFRAFVSNSTSFMVTTNALLTVLPDTTPPALLSALGYGDGTILLTFSKPLASPSAGNIGNYLVTNSLGQSAVLSSATLTNGSNVVLSFSTMPVGAFTVVVNNVRDTTAAQNLIAPNSPVPVGADYFIPMTSAWKYLITNTNTVVQASFMQPGYDDSAWAGSSNALFYLENAALPAPKNTPLVNQLNGHYINVHYFRQSFFAPFAASGVTLQIRHIIDDGMVLHLNGQEIYRFNMPAGPVTVGTISVSTIADATLVGPISIPVSNFIPGTNVFAVELHQAGPSSGDRVMGVEISIHVPGAPPPIIVNPPSPRPSRPYLELLRLGQSQVLYWTEPGFTLECANDLTGPWLPSPGTSPYLLSPTNAVAFYRLWQ